MSDESEFQRQFDAIRTSFLAELQPKQRLIREHWGRLQADGRHEDLESLYVLVHRLAGSGETFGCGELSEQARRVDHLLAPTLKDDAPLALSGDLEDAVDALLNLMETAIRAPE